MSFQKNVTGETNGKKKYKGHKKLHDKEPRAKEQYVKDAHIFNECDSCCDCSKGKEKHRWSSKMDPIEVHDDMVVHDKESADFIRQLTNNYNNKYPGSKAIGAGEILNGITSILAMGRGGGGAGGAGGGTPGFLSNLQNLLGGTSNQIANPQALQVPQQSVQTQSLNNQVFQTQPLNPQVLQNQPLNPQNVQPTQLGQQVQALLNQQVQTPLGQGIVNNPTQGFVAHVVPVTPVIAKNFNSSDINFVLRDGPHGLVCTGPSFSIVPSSGSGSSHTIRGTFNIKNDSPSTTSGNLSMLSTFGGNGIPKMNSLTSGNINIAGRSIPVSGRVESPNSALLTYNISGIKPGTTVPAILNFCYL